MWWVWSVWPDLHTFNNPNHEKCVKWNVKSFILSPFPAWWFSIRVVNLEKQKLNRSSSDKIATAKFWCGFLKIKAMMLHLSAQIFYNITPYVQCTLYIRVGQYESNLRFFIVIVISKLIYLHMSRNKQDFDDPCKNSRRKFNDVLIFLALRRDTTTVYCTVYIVQDKGPMINVVRFICCSSLKHNFTVALKKRTVF